MKPPSVASFCQSVIFKFIFSNLKDWAWAGRMSKQLRVQVWLKHIFTNSHKLEGRADNLCMAVRTLAEPEVAVPVASQAGSLEHVRLWTRQ